MTPSYVQNNTMLLVQNLNLCGTSDAIALATNIKTFKSMKMINTDKNFIDTSDSGSEKSPLTIPLGVLRFPHFSLAFWLLHLVVLRVISLRFWHFASKGFDLFRPMSSSSPCLYYFEYNLKVFEKHFHYFE